MTSHARVRTNFVHMEPDTSKHSAAYKIFNYEWDVKIPHMYVYSDDFMRVSGVVVSDPGYDARLPKQMIGGRYTIAQLAQLMDEGATIEIVNPEDAKRIYDIVSEHLENWSGRLIATSTFDLKNAPTDDLMKLSQLADVLYGFAARFFTHERPRGSLARRLDQIRGRGRRSAGRQYVDPNQVAAPEEKPKMQDHSASTQTILRHGSRRDAWS